MDVAVAVHALNANKHGRRQMQTTMVRPSVRLSVRPSVRQLRSSIFTQYPLISAPADLLSRPRCRWRGAVVCLLLSSEYVRFYGLGLHF